MSNLENHQSINISEISLPRGGGSIKGLGETFQPNLFSGTGSHTIPFPISKARGLEPEISITYNSGSGNGSFGMGYSLGLEKITLRTEQCIPKYDDKDIYLLNGTELVKNNENSEKKSGYIIQKYFPRIQKKFLLIKHFIKEDFSESYWEVTSTENITTIFGKENSTRIYNPKKKTQIFEWLIQEKINAKGNKIEYSYKAENKDNIPNSIENQGHSYNNKYIQCVKYGNFFDSNNIEKYAFEIIFDYGEYYLEKLDKDGKNPCLPTREWSYRKDAFSSFLSGFEIRTCRLCKNILLFHCFENELGASSLTKRLELIYTETTSYDEIEIITPATLKSLQLIGYQREGKLATDKYQSQKMPSIEFGFSKFNISLTPKFKQLEIEGDSIPDYLNTNGFIPIDFNAEGISGLLYTKGNSVMYCEPKGGGEYGFPKEMNEFPITSRFETGEVALVSLEGNGELDLVYNGHNQRGYYKRKENESWNNFEVFQQNPTIYENEHIEQVDLSNNGKTDLLLAKKNTLEVYPSSGIKGYDSSIEKIAPSNFPLVKKGYKNEFVGFANIFGDGLPHRIKITNGNIECWPNLGYGDFGEKITLGNVPYFEDGFDNSRLFFADIDGSGTSDLVYVESSQVTLFINQSGNSFSDAIKIRLPEVYSSIDQISFADILGNGTTCLVFTKIDNTPRHYYYDFVGEITIDGVTQKSMKPYLLNTIDNNLGAHTQIQYCSSTKFYLEDKKNGASWITKLPFPVQLVEKKIVTDKISGARYTHRFKYHDGYYDSVERQFRGFGYVESWDTEDYEGFRAGIQRTDGQVIDKKNFAPPVYTRTWHHTGVPFKEQSLRAYYKKQYFKGDTKAYDFPDSVFNEEIYKQDSETVRQAYSSLKGQVIRTEVYGEDKEVHPNVYQNPYAVAESNVEVSLCQQKGENTYAVFMINPRESINYHYERNPKDPRIQQEFTLKTDKFGNTIQSCSICLPRRSDVNTVIYPEQKELKGLLNWNQFVLPPVDYLYCHNKCEIQSFELFGIDLDGYNYFSYDKIKSQIDTLELPGRDNIIPYNQSLPRTKGVQAGQLGWNRSLFWDEAQTDCLPLGQITDLGLVHHHEKAALTKEMAIDIFNGRLIDTTSYTDKNYFTNIIYTKGGYFFDEGSNYWWNKGLVQHYFKSNKHKPKAFYLPTKVENTFAVNSQKSLHPQEVSLCSKSTVDYDPYYLRVVKTSQELSNTISISTSAIIDYITLKPKELIDINENRSQVLFDPLGQVIVTSLFGTEKDIQIGGMTLYPSDSTLAEYKQQELPTFEAILKKPESYLQGASTYFYYNLSAWKDKQQPVCSIHLIRNQYWNSSEKDIASYCQIGVAYNDGLGRDIETKLKVDSGESYVINEKSICELKLIENRWKVSGRTLFNNKGKPFAKYNPYYTNTSEYENQEKICSSPPTVIHYDALEREIQVDTPKGFFSKVEFTPWQVNHFDENDTILDAPYFKENYPAKVSPEEKIAIDQAIKCYNTPATDILDVLGQTCFKVQNNLGNVTENAFEEIVKGIPITSSEIRNALIIAEYLKVNTTHSSYPLTFLTNKFQPYKERFTLDLPAKFNTLIPNIIEVLKQNFLTEYYTYDILGRLKSSIDPRLYYSNLTKETDYTNFQYQYPMEEKKPMWVHSVDAGLEEHLSNIYDKQLWSWSPRSYCQLIDYDRLQRKIKLNVQKITYEGNVKNYDSFNQVEAFTYGESLANAHDYNLKGQLYEIKDLSGIVTNYQYSMLGEVQQTSRQILVNYKEAANWKNTQDLQTEKYTTSYTYNALKQKLSETTPDGSIISNTYNQAGLLYSIQLTFQGGTSKDVISQITYYANDQRAEVQYGNGITTNNVYEETTLRLLTLKSKNTSLGDTQNLAYTYDPVGNITNIIDKSIDTVFHANQKVDPVMAYDYDALYQLTKATGRQHIGINANTYKNNNSEGSFMQSIYGPPPSTNDAGKLENYTETYTYDDSGNLILKKHIAKSTSYTRDLAVEANCNRLQGLDYDASGNLRQLDINNPVALSFNCCENLVKAAVIQRPDVLDDADYYVYDSQEMRTRKVSELMAQNGTVTEIEDKLYLGNYEIIKNYTGSAESPSSIKKVRQSIRVMDGDSCVLIVQYIKTDSTHLKKEGTTLFRYQLTNHLGSVSLELNENAQLISYEEYFPYGGTAIITGENQVEVALKEYRYSGKERDNTTGLYYYGARYYAPWLGRWLKPDPAGTVDGMNVYAFVKGNPITHVDDNGNMFRPTGVRWASTLARDLPHMTGAPLTKARVGGTTTATTAPEFSETVATLTALESSQWTETNTWEGQYVLSTSQPKKRDAWPKSLKDKGALLKVALMEDGLKGKSGLSTVEFSHLIAYDAHGSMDEKAAPPATYAHNGEMEQIEHAIRKIYKSHSGVDKRLEFRHQGFLVSGQPLTLQTVTYPLGTLIHSNFELYVDGDKTYEHTLLGIRHTLSPQEAANIGYGVFKSLTTALNKSPVAFVPIGSKADSVFHRFSTNNPLSK